jgi:hypothetical protein
MRSAAAGGDPFDGRARGDGGQSRSMRVLSGNQNMRERSYAQKETEVVPSLSVKPRKDRLKVNVCLEDGVAGGAHQSLSLRM